MKKIFFLISLIAACNLISNSSFAKDALYDSQEKNNETDLSKKIKFSLITEVYLGDFKVEMEKTTLKDVINFLGSGDIFHHGDASESEYWICYNAKNNHHIFNIKLASGEMGGNDHTVGQFVIQLVKRKKLNQFKKCDNIPGILSTISIAGRSWLLLEKKETEKILGIPSYIKNSWWKYEYSRKLPQDGELMSEFSLHFTNNRIDQFELSQVTSY